MTSRALMNVMFEAGANPASIVIMDSDYSLPTREWFLGDFQTASRIFLGDLKLLPYLKEQWDCDDFSLTQLWLSKVLHRQTAAKLKGKGLAVGMFSYDDKEIGDHTISFAVVKETGVYVPVFAEPQTGLHKELSKKEILSCFSYVI